METGIGKRIRKRRLEVGLTQDQLAALMGYTSKTSISKIETGKEDNLTLDRVAKFAAVLDTTPGYIMGWQDAELSMDNADALADLMHDAELLENVKKIMMMDIKKREALYKYIDFLSSNN